MKSFKITLFIALFAILFSKNFSLAADGQNVDVLDLLKPSANIMPAQKGMQEVVSLDLRSIDITDALKYIALKSGINVVVSKTTTGKVTLVVRDVLLKDAFDIILRSNGLGYEKVGNIYYVMTDEDYKKLYGKSFSDVRIVKTFRLKYAIPEQAFNFIEALKSDIGRVVVEQENGTIVALDTPETMKKIEKAIDAIDQKGNIKIFDLQYAKAKDIEGFLKDQLNLKKLGTARADERSNQVIVYTLPDKMREVEEIVKALDKKTKQVFINAQIMKITLTDDYDTGVDWAIIFNELNNYLMKWVKKNGPITAAVSLPIDTLLTAFGSFTIGSITDDDYEVTMQFLKTLGETKILSNPRLAVMNNQEARIHVGRREVYVTTTTTTGQTTQTTAEEATFIDVGIQLAVTPIINDEGFITIKIKPEISSVVDSYTTPSGNVIPIVDTSTAETTVVVKDGSTIIIGGLRREDKVLDDKGIPILSSIPLIGELFKSRNDSYESTELLIFITPKIVTGERLVTGDNKMDSKERFFIRDKEYERINFQEEGKKEAETPHIISKKK